MLSAPYAPARRSQRRRAALVLLTAPASSRPLVSATLCGFFVHSMETCARLVCADGASGDPGPSPQRGGGAIDAGSCPSPAA